MVRLHRFELYARVAGTTEIDAVDQVICVSPHYADLDPGDDRLARREGPTVPNWVDDAQFDRPSSRAPSTTWG